MAIVCSAVATPSTIKCTLTGLSNPANQYNQFYFKVWKWNGSTWIFDTEAYFTSTNLTTTCNYTFSGREALKTYLVWGYAKWNNVWYPAAPGNSPYYESSQVTTMIPAPSYYLSSATCATLTIYRKSGTTEGAIQTWVKRYGSWYSIQDSGFGYSTNGDLITVTGLDASTTHEWDFRTYVGTVYLSTLVNYATVLPPTPTAPYLVSRSEGSLNLAWGYVTDATGYKVRYNTPNGYSYIDFISNSGYLSTNFYGAQHFIGVAAKRNNSVGNYSSDTTVVMAPKTPTIYAVSVSSTTITIDQINMAGTLYTDFIVEYKLSTGSTYSTITGVSLPYTISNLTAGSTYHVKAKSRVSYSGVYTNSVYDSFILTVQLNSRPALFNWDTIRTSGMPYNTSKIKASEWIRLQQNINAVRNYKSMNDYIFTPVSSGQIFYYYNWNEVLAAISVLNYTNLPPVGKSSGNKMYATEFDTLKNCLNSVQ